jgi:hypothetical protein
MDGHGDHEQCAHDGFHSGLGRYSHENEHIRYVLICDECGADVREVSVESYAPNPLFEIAA